MTNQKKEESIDREDYRKSLTDLAKETIYYKEANATGDEWAKGLICPEHGDTTLAILCDKCRIIYCAKKLLHSTETRVREMQDKNIGMLRQWLNEDRITDPNKMVTNEDIKHWLDLSEK